VWRGHSCPRPLTRGHAPAAKRRKNTVHGASRGKSGENNKPQRGERLVRQRSTFVAKRRSYAVERSLGAGEPNSAEGNSDKNLAHWDGKSSTTAVILRQRSPWQSQGLPTKDLCTPRLPPAWRGRSRPRDLEGHGFSHAATTPILIQAPGTIRPSREAAKEYSPRRKPWGKCGTQQSPSGAKDGLQANPSLIRY
jgi:hypothetical protein